MTGLKRAIAKHVPKKILQPFQDLYYVQRLKRYPEHRKPEFRVFRRFVSEGDTVLDIGANVGIYTKLLAAVVGPTGRIYSYEPVDTTFRSLTAVVRALRLSNVELNNCAVSDVDGEVAMSVPTDAHGVPRYSEAHVLTEPQSDDVGLRPRAVRLDSTLAELKGTVTLVKCDVEGHELSCLKGAENFTARFRPIWYIEMTRNKREIFDWFRTHGYEAFVIEAGDLAPAGPTIWSMNYLFAPEGMAAQTLIRDGR